MLKFAVGAVLLYLLVHDIKYIFSKPKNRTHNQFVDNSP